MSPTASETSFASAGVDAPGRSSSAAVAGSMAGGAVEAPTFRVPKSGSKSRTGGELEGGAPGEVDPEEHSSGPERPKSKANSSSDRPWA